MDDLSLSPEFFSDLQAHYKDMPAVDHYERIRQGQANLNYSIYTAKGKYFLKIISQTQEKSLLRQISFYDCISHSGIQTIYPIRNNGNEYVTAIDGRKIMLFPYKEISEPEINETNMAVIGKLTAALHMAEVKGNIKLEKAKYSKDDCIALLNDAGDLIEKKYAKYKKYIEKISNDLPKGFVFDDICPDNLYADKSGILGFIDPENAGFGEFIFDIAGALVMCCFPLGNRFRLCEVYLKSYAQGRAITQSEKECLFEALIFICVHLSLFFELHPLPKNTRKIALRLGFADMLIEIGKEQFYKAINI